MATNNKLEIPAGLAADVAKRLGCETPAAIDYIEVALQNALLFDRKQRDYGPENMRAYGSFGVIVRASDKFSRLQNLYANRRKKATNESILDTYRDINVYMNIAIMLETGHWPQRL